MRPKAPITRHELEWLRRLVDSHGEEEAARRLHRSRLVVARMLAGLDVYDESRDALRAAMKR